jgi:hypothetical protein
MDQDDERWYDDGPEGTEVLEGVVEIVVSLVTLPILIVKTIYQFFRWYFLEWIDAP